MGRRGECESAVKPGSVAAKLVPPDGRRPVSGDPGRDTAGPKNTYSRGPSGTQAHWVVISQGSRFAALKVHPGLGSVAAFGSEVAAGIFMRFYGSSSLEDNCAPSWAKRGGSLRKPGRGRDFREVSRIVEPGRQAANQH